MRLQEEIPAELSQLELAIVDSLLRPALGLTIAALDLAEIGRRSWRKVRDHFVLAYDRLLAFKRIALSDSVISRVADLATIAVTATLLLEKFLDLK